MTIFRATSVLALMCALGSTASAQLIIAHRGASHDAPENSLAAFKLAIEQGADGFEADFYLGAGGQIVCLHDKDTERVAGKKLLVTKAPFDAAARARCWQLEGSEVGTAKGCPRWRSAWRPCPPARSSSSS